MGAARDWTGAWSLDGEQIAFTRGVGPAQIWVMDADGSDVQQITTDTDDSWPTWSPDGTKLLSRRFGTVRPSLRNGLPTDRTRPT